MSFTICIVDDDERSQKDLVDALVKIQGIQITAIESDPIIAVSKILSGVLNVDIVFSDLEMPEMTGLELCDQIGKRAVVIYVTGHPDFALDAFNTDAADFITKPVNAKDIFRAIEKAKEKLAARSKLSIPSAEKYIFIKLSPRNISRLLLNDILSIEVDGKYVNINILNQKTISLKRSLSAIAEQLPNDLFMKISKSCIINLNHLSTIVNNRLVLDTGSVHLIGSTYMTEVYARYESW